MEFKTSKKLDCCCLCPVLLLGRADSSAGRCSFWFVFLRRYRELTDLYVSLHEFFIAAPTVHEQTRFQAYNARDVCKVFCNLLVQSIVSPRNVFCIFASSPFFFGGGGGDTFAYRLPRYQNTLDVLTLFSRQVVSSLTNKNETTQISRGETLAGFFVKQR